MPQSKNQEGKAFLWDLNNFSTNPGTGSVTSAGSEEKPTSTPQLIKAVNFEEAFQAAQSSPSPAIITSESNTYNGNDKAEWLYFSPAEFSTEPPDQIYAAFKNTGDSAWSDSYFLEFYAGSNPCKEEIIHLGQEVLPGEQVSFKIPVTKKDGSWKACWQLKNKANEAFYDFCYSHGTGINSQTASTGGDTPSGSASFYAFTKTDGSAPARFSNSELSAEFVSTSPASGHNFAAYDHHEDFSVTFKNSGSRSWDSSYSLVFYSGYNWMHAYSFPLPGNVSSGESVTITMPMEIFEDNDRWVTCWYLSTPDGKNLSDFCFNYTTSG